MRTRHWSPRETWEALHADQLPAFIGRDVVCALTGWTRSLLDERCRERRFPKPQIISARGRTTLLWDAEQVRAWLAQHGKLEPPATLPWRGPFRRPKHERVAERD